MELLDRLAEHKGLAGTPREQLAWLAAHGRLLRLEAGPVAVAKTTLIESLWIVLSGHLSIRIQRSSGSRKVMEWQSGDLAGFLPYSRMTAPPGDVTAEETTELLIVHRDNFREMARECHELTTTLVHAMLDRARIFTTSDLQVEKMASLGKLAAGLAHELNNPASAVGRTAEGLSTHLAELELTARAVGAARLSDTQLAAIDGARTGCVGETRSILSPIERANREDTFEGWLTRHGLEPAIADSLIDTPLDLNGLDELARGLDTRTLDLIIRYLSASCLTRRLAAEVESAASRISKLVAAVKRFTYMDQAAVPEPVDIGQGLSDTIAVLGAKARQKSIGVTLEVPPKLPTVLGFGSELNQVWLNLIDNALDAVPAGGHVAITVRPEGRFVVVRVIDDGPGIPDDIRDKIFEPFFTTKPVGVGTGLGLEIAWRLVQRHKGEINVLSQRGQTEFSVSLPVDK
ncbi:MAG: sensor histidine kinase [Vicinamibacterales bacterium]